MSEAMRARELHGAGQLQMAAIAYRNALATTPSDITLRRDFAVLLMQSAKEAEAVILLDHEDVLGNADADLLSILALCLRATGRDQRALDIARETTIRDPGNPLGWMLVGNLLVATGAAAAAQLPLQQAVTLEPGFAEAWHYLGESLQAQRKWDEAIQAYRRAATQQPGEIVNIALCHALAGRTDAALHDFSVAHRMMPARADVLAQLAHCQAMLCLHDEQDSSVRMLAASLAAPGLHSEPEPFLLSTLEVPEALKAASIKRHAQAIAAGTIPSRQHPASMPHPFDRRVRIGYLSADLGEHAIGTLVRDHFAAHNRDRFEVIGYSLVSTANLPSDIADGFDLFIDATPFDDDSLAERIRQDRIDVLIDMAGFTLGARPGVLAQRPAALQWGWLGFIHGQQAPWLDALLLDPNIQPAEAGWIYDDRVIRLPGTLFPATSMQPGVRDRARFGLPEDAFVFASFNNTYKLSRELIRSWSRILTQADEAHLMVYLPRLARAGFLRQWASFDGPTARLHLVDKIDLEEQAHRAASCDLFLDAFHYQAGATAIHAISNGLPLLCVEGPGPLARLGASINRFLGMDALVCAHADDYVRRAVQLAKTPALLIAQQQRLQQQIAERGLFDPRRAAAAIEEAVLQQLGHHAAESTS